MIAVAPWSAEEARPTGQERSLKSGRDLLEIIEDRTGQRAALITSQVPIEYRRRCAARSGCAGAPLIPPGRRSHSQRAARATGRRRGLDLGLVADRGDRDLVDPEAAEQVVFSEDMKRFRGVSWGVSVHNSTRGHSGSRLMHYSSIARIFGARHGAVLPMSERKCVLSGGVPVRRRRRRVGPPRNYMSPDPSLQ